MPSAIRLILRSVAAQPGRVSKDAGWRCSRLFPTLLRRDDNVGRLPAAGGHARLARTAKEGGADGAQDLWHPALARLSHPVDGEGTGARLRKPADRHRGRPDAYARFSQDQPERPYPG